MDAWLAFMLGLVGSLHCVQMCGPLILSASLPLARQTRARQFKAQLAYHFGRGCTYTLLGAGAGALGGAVGLIGRLAGIEQTAAMVGGVLLLVAALTMGGVMRWGRLAATGVFRHASTLSRLAATLMGSTTIAACTTLGLALGFLPCGLIYGALLKAAATGSAVGGAVTMAAFAAGTMSALLAVGVFAVPLGRWAGRWSTRTAALALALMGALMLWRGVSGVHPHAVPGRAGHAGAPAVHLGSAAHAGSPSPPAGPR